MYGNDRFVFCFLHISSPFGLVGHTNVLVFDQTHACLERFEPYGAHFSNENTAALDEVLAKTVLPTGWTYKPPSSFCPYHGAPIA
jgi:hypothetical protein